MQDLGAPPSLPCPFLPYPTCLVEASKQMKTSRDAQSAEPSLVIRLPYPNQSPRALARPFPANPPTHTPSLQANPVLSYTVSSEGAGKRNMSVLDKANKSRGNSAQLLDRAPEPSSPEPPPEPPPQTVPAAGTRSGDRARDSPILVKQPYGTARGPGFRTGKHSNSQ